MRAWGFIAIILFVHIIFLDSFSFGLKAFGQPKIRIAAIDATVIPLSESNRSRLSDSVKETIQENQRYELISDDVVSGYKTKAEKDEEKELKEMKDKVEDASASFEKGKKLYENISYDQAISELSDAARLYQENIAALTSNEKLVQSQLLLAIGYMAVGREADAKRSFENMLKFDKNVDLEKMGVSPKVTALFNQVKKEQAIYDKSTLELTCDVEGANFYFNAKLMGKFSENKPIIISDLVPGDYSILVEKEGYNRAYKTFVATKGQIKVSIGLVSSSKQKFSKLSEMSKAQARDFLSDFARDPNIQAELVLVYSLIKSVDKYKLKTPVFEERRGEFSKGLSITVGGNLRFVEDPAKKVTAEVLLYVDEEGHVTMEPAAVAKAEQAPAPQPAVTDQQQLDQAAQEQLESGEKDKEFIRKEYEDEGFETKRAIAWSIVGVIILGGAITAAILLWPSQSGGQIEIWPPAY